MPYYPSYQPTFYNPYLYQPQTQQTQQNTGIVWISSEREAAMYPVAPNNAVTLWNQNEPVVYLKTADALWSVSKSPWRNRRKDSPRKKSWRRSLELYGTLTALFQHSQKRLTD